MGKKKFKIQPKNWPKEYTFEEFKRFNPNINENVLINYYNKYLQEYAENYSRHIKYFENNKKLLSNNLQEIKSRYDDSQYFLEMYYRNSTAAAAGSYPIFTPTDPGGLINWYDATEGITLKSAGSGAGVDISEWQSKVGTNHLLEGPSIGGTGANEPGLNSEGTAVEFVEGLTNDGLTFTTPLNLGAFTLFFVIKLAITETNKYFGLLRGSNDENMYLFGKKGDVLFDFILDDHAGNTDTTISGLNDRRIINDSILEDKCVLFITKDAPENARVRVYLNNASSFTQANEGAGSLELDENIPFTPEMLGPNAGGNRHLNGELFEWGVYDKELSETDRAQLYYYLGIKHNIPGYDGPSTLESYNYPDTGYLP